MEQKLIAKADKKRRKRYAELFRSSGIGKESVHGLMVRRRLLFLVSVHVVVLLFVAAAMFSCA
jgi:hypothetical protein